MRFATRDSRPVLRPSGERLDPGRVLSRAERLLMERHLFAYELVSQYVAKGSLVADVGCGLGYGTHLLAESGFEAVGIDTDSAAVRQAETTYGTGRCRFETLENDTMPFSPDSFQALVAFQVIEHVPDPIGFLRELGRVVGPGGIVLLTTPNRVGRVADGERPWNRFHLREYDASEFGEVIAEVFDDSSVKGIDAAAWVKEIELSRVAKLRKLARLDPLRLRRFLPQPLIERVSRAGSSSAEHDHSPPPDFEVTDRGHDAIDLLAVIRVR